MSTHAPIRVAIVGAGLMGRWHAHAAVRAGATVAVVVDADLERATRLAARHRGACALGEIDVPRIARDAGVAHVCTPLPTHREIIGELLAGGVHVLAEKPLTDDAASTRALLEIAAARGVLLCPVHQMPFQRGVESLLHRLPSLGDVLHLDFVACSAGAAGQGAAEQDQLVDDILPHPLSLIRRVLGAEVASLVWQVAHPRPGEMRAIASLRSTVLSVSVSSHGRPTSNAMRVIGTHGTADVDLFHGYAAFHRGRASRVGKLVQPFSNGARTIVTAGANLARRAVDREPAYPGLTALVRGFYAAAAGAAPVPISPAETADIAAARDHLRAARERAD